MNIFNYAIQDTTDIASGLSVDVHKGLDIIRCEMKMEYEAVS